MTIPLSIDYRLMQFTQYPRRWVLPLFLRRNGSRALEHYSLMRDLQWEAPAEIRRYQMEALCANLRHALSVVAYYRKLGMDPGSVTPRNAAEMLRGIPVLTKATLRDQFQNLSAIDLEPGVRTFLNTSGGSTGEPVLFMQDNIYKDWQAAAMMLFEEWAGRSVTDLEIKLWGSERDIINESEGLRKRAGNIMRNRILLDAFHMTERGMVSYVATINTCRPRVILAYVDAVYELARFIRDHGLAVVSPGAVITSAGTLYPEQRMLIGEVFGCPVFDQYGSREMGQMAGDCERHEGLHLNMFNNYMEILDENDQPCPPGKEGRIVVTTLHNRTMPLIRYEIGDMGIMAEKPCSCGRGLPMLERVVGRSTEVFRNSRGDVVSGHFFNRQLFFRTFIKKFQIIQESPNHLVVKVVLGQGDDLLRHQDDLRDLEHRFRSVMGDDVRVEVIAVEAIEPLASGKYIYTISKVGRQVP